MNKFNFNNSGFSLMELLVSAAILVVLMAAGYSCMISGQSIAFTTDTSIGIRKNLRQVTERISREVRETGYDSTATAMFTILDNTGAGGSDILRFQIPVICESDGEYMDTNGDVANWGAPLTWGCSSSSCMDADDDCSTQDYEYIEYRMNASNQIVRRVLDSSATSISETIIADDNIIDFQVTNPSTNRITIIISASATSRLNTVVTDSTALDIYLRNRG